MQDQRGAVIPAIATASSTAAVRSLGRQGIKTIVVSEHDRPPAFRSKYCDLSIKVPDPETDLGGYEQALLSLARREDVSTILPFREADIYVLARNREELSEHVATPWPTLQKLRRVQDRIDLRDAADAAGVSIPETRVVQADDTYDQPTIIKPRYTVHAPEYGPFDQPRPERGSTTYLPQGESPDIAALEESYGHRPLRQRYVPTTSEYGFFALYDEGEPVTTFQHRQRRGWKYAGGPSAYRESVSIPQLESAGLALLDELDWHGVAMVEFLQNPDSGEFELMEINPRFWSSLPFTIQAGVDFPWLYWQHGTSGSVPDTPPYRVGIGGHLLRGEALHLHSILREEYPLVERPSFPKTLGEVALSMIREPRFDYLSRDDPGPMLGEIEFTLSGMIREYLAAPEPDRQSEDEKTELESANGVHGAIDTVNGTGTHDTDTIKKSESSETGTTKASNSGDTASDRPMDVREKLSHPVQSITHVGKKSAKLLNGANK